MLNSNDWQETYGQFLTDSQVLLHKLEECISHLELIGDDEDAVACMVTTFDRLGAQASQASVDSIAAFASRLSGLLSGSDSSGELSREALTVLKSCLTLIAWQLELLDPRTGELPLDGDEQQDLLDNLAGACGVTEPTTDCALK
jgi:chemotaxis protein histidine kinase CheA